MIRRYSFRAEPQGDTYKALVQFAAARASSVLLVVRPDLSLAASAMDTLARLRPHLRVEEQRDAWPGTKLWGGLATLGRYDFVPEVASILASVATGLFQWRQPELPEDLCFLRGNERPWLVSIAHESDAYFEGSEPEHEELLKAVPGLPVTLNDVADPD